MPETQPISVHALGSPWADALGPSAAGAVPGQARHAATEARVKSFSCQRIKHIFIPGICVRKSQPAVSLLLEESLLPVADRWAQPLRPGMVRGSRTARINPSE